jgi:hypothetical protein
MRALLERAEGDGGAGWAGHHHLASQIVNQRLEAELLDFFERHPLHHLGHIRRGGHADGAALALERDVLDPPVRADPGEHLHAVRAAGIAAYLVNIGAFERATVARIIVVIYEKFDSFLTIHTHRIEPLSAIRFYCSRQNVYHSPSIRRDDGQGSASVAVTVCIPMATLQYTALRPQASDLRAAAIRLRLLRPA